MPMQTGVGFLKILLYVGAACTGAMLYENTKFSDVLGKLQTIVEKLEKSKEQSRGDSDYSDVVAAAAQALTKYNAVVFAQVRRLAMKVQQPGNNCQIIVRNENSGHSGNMTSLIIPAATLGAMGCGYLWWKGFLFSDLMCVTKGNMANAVSNLTKYLEHVTEALATTKRHLKQRIENLDDKMMKQNEHVAEIQKSLYDIGFDLRQLQNIVSSLPEKISSLEYKQELANVDLLYLRNFADGKKGKIPEVLKVGQLESPAYILSGSFTTLAAILYVHDLSEECGTSTSDQFILYKEIKKRFGDHFWLDVVSKCDLLQNIFGTSLDQSKSSDLELEHYKKLGPVGILNVSVKNELGLVELKDRAVGLPNGKNQRSKQQPGGLVLP